MKPLWILTDNNYVHVSPTLLLLYLDSEGFRPTVSKTGDKFPHIGTAIHTCLVNKSGTTPTYSCNPSLFSPFFSAHSTGFRRHFQTTNYKEGVTA